MAKFKAPFYKLWGKNYKSEDFIFYKFSNYFKLEEFIERKREVNF